MRGKRFWSDLILEWYETVNCGGWGILNVIQTNPQEIPLHILARGGGRLDRRGLIFIKGLSSAFTFLVILPLWAAFYWSSFLNFNALACSGLPSPHKLTLNGLGLRIRPCPQKYNRFPDCMRIGTRYPLRTLQWNGCLMYFLRTTTTTPFKSLLLVANAID